jgi:hypothetical protein
LAGIFCKSEHSSGIRAGFMLQENLRAKYLCNDFPALLRPAILGGDFFHTEPMYWFTLRSDGGAHSHTNVVYPVSVHGFTLNHTADSP